MTTSLVVHGHFYQPPRENPWTGFVEREPGARPFHDWNERILAECYRPNGAARVVDGHGRIERLVNNYILLSYNFGPTLLNWIERHDPAVYGRILAADKHSADRNDGHGNAIAQGYNHTILPLEDPRDMRTQIRWGIADFRHRFGRQPEALWLPETACNDAVLDALIEEGLRYAILSPYQAARVRPLDGDEESWTDVGDGSIDTGQAYRRSHGDGSGRSLALFFYNGPAARAVAFEGALTSSEVFVDRLGRANGHDGGLVNVATDGESYGHHTHFGDRALAYALAVQAPQNGFRVTNYGAFLDEHPPTMEVQVKSGPDGEGTSWSCAHGVGRWYRDCGCYTGGEEGWNQAWRTPLRDALRFLRDEAARVFEEEGGSFWSDPWAVRDAYVWLVLDGFRSRAAFLQEHSGRPLTEEEQVRAMQLLEMQRHALLMFTSCGWFFNDISGIETLQVLTYAARVLDYFAELGRRPPRDAFTAILADAQSNVAEYGSGADIFRTMVEPGRVSPRRIAAHVGISSLANGIEEDTQVGGYETRRSELRTEQRDRITLATCRVEMENLATGQREDFALAAMHFGGIDFYCVLKPFPGRQLFQEAVQRIWDEVPTASLPHLLRRLEQEFGPDEYGLEHVLPEGRERIARKVFGALVDRFVDAYARLYEENRFSMEMLQLAGLEMPPVLRAAGEFTLGRRFEDEIREQHQSADPEAYQKAIEIAEQAARHAYRLDSQTVRDLFEGMITDAVALAVEENDEEATRTALALVALTRRLRLNLPLERAQELLYEAITGGEVTPIGPLRLLGLSLGLAPRLLGTESPRTQET